jgi:hypothetical protein
MSFISMNVACGVFQHPLKTTMFLWFQMIHRVRIATVCPLLPPVPNVCLYQSSRSSSSLQIAGFRLSQELQEACGRTA